MFLIKCLEELQDEAKTIVPSKLLNLSGLSRQEAEEFQRGWSKLRISRRREVLEKMLDLAKNNFDLDFVWVFRVCLQDPDPVIRELAILGLWECEERSLMTALIVVLKQDSVEYVRAAAARALGKFTVLATEGKLLPKDRDRLVETLLCVLSDPREGEEVQRRALEAVAPLDVPEVMNHIRTAYNSNRPKLRCSALSAMGRTCRSEWLPLLLQELKSSDAKIRREAIVGCGELGDRQAVPYLIPLTQEGDLDIQLCAIQALGRLGGRLAKRVLMKCARSDDPRVQDAAQDALELLEAEESALTPVFDE